MKFELKVYCSRCGSTINGNDALVCAGCFKDEADRIEYFKAENGRLQADIDKLALELEKARMALRDAHVEEEKLLRRVGRE